MKTSNIKPTLSIEQARDLPALEDIAPDSFRQLTEGHFSQVFSYETSAGEKRVFRLGRKEYSFKADKYASGHFTSPNLPIPEVIDIGQIEPGLFYCISKFVPGKPSDQLSPQELEIAKSAMEQTFASIFKTDISRTSGEGDINTDTGNGEGKDFREVLKADRQREDSIYLKNQCQQHNIDPSLVGEFTEQFKRNINYRPTERRLLHGDLGSDNVLIRDDRVTAVLDWSGMGYGDWLHDYSRLEFWYPGRHTPAREFAKEYDLETEDFESRWLAHMAAHALSTLDFAFRYESQQTIDWFRQYLPSKLAAGGT